MVQLHALIHTELLEPLSRGTLGRLYRATKPVRAWRSGHETTISAKDITVHEIASK